MRKITLYRPLFLFALLGLFGFTWPFGTTGSNSSWVNSELQLIKPHAGNIDSNVLRLSLTAYEHAKQQGMPVKQFLTVIDYSKPSTARRLWVFDLRTGRTLFNTWVSHGKNSGQTMATSFSNAPGSLKSSIGVFMTGSPYFGKNGYSLHLRGLEPGVNDNAYRRSVVFHGAWYVNPDTIKRYGQVGRSWGCPAVSKDLSKSIIDTIKGQSLVFAYYPDRRWLTHSQFLTA